MKLNEIYSLNQLVGMYIKEDFERFNCDPEVNDEILQAMQLLILFYLSNDCEVYQ
jgi:hypothetical protein